MPTFSLKVDGLDISSKKIRDRIERMKNLAPVLDVIAASVDKLMKDSFRSSVTPENKPWPPLSEVTIAQRKKKSSKPLVDTGVLRNSTYARASETGVVFGTNVPYAGAQNFGAEIKGIYSTKILEEEHQPGNLRERAGARHLRGVRGARTRKQRATSAALGGPRFAQKARKRRRRSQMFGPRTPEQNRNSSDSKRARAGKPYTITIPARAFLPWDKTRNEFMVYGPAGALQQKIYKQITEYISTGRILR